MRVQIDDNKLNINGQVLIDYNNVSILTQMVNQFKEIKDKLKPLQSNGSEYVIKYNLIKLCLNSMYGILSQQGNWLYQTYLSALITCQGWNQLKSLLQHVNVNMSSINDSVIFCNTDSLFVCNNSIKHEYKDDLLKHVNEFSLSVSNKVWFSLGGVYDKLYVLTTKNAYLYANKINNQE